MIIGTTRFKTGSYHVNDCLVLEGYIANCGEQGRRRVVKMIGVEELGSDERGRRVVSSFLAMMDGGNVEMFESRASMCMATRGIYKNHPPPTFPACGGVGCDSC